MPLNGPLHITKQLDEFEYSHLLTKQHKIVISNINYYKRPGGMKGGSTCGCINDFHGKMCISGCMDRSEQQPINCFYAENPPLRQ